MSEAVSDLRQITGILERADLSRAAQRLAVVSEWLATQIEERV